MNVRYKIGVCCLGAITLSLSGLDAQVTPMSAPFKTAPSVQKIGVQDSLWRTRHTHPHLETALKILSINTAVWGFDRFIMKEDWAYISGQSIKRNFRHGPIWDSNGFTTNLFSHPFHGSLYFNAARTSGLSFGQSIPYVLGGSFMWEFFMETEYPSINDLMATTFGGIAIGEMGFRVTDLLVDNRTTGAARVGREVLIGILSPIRAIDRLLSGEAWKKSAVRGNVLEDYPFRVAVSGGVRTLHDPQGESHFKTGATWKLGMQYGELDKGFSYQPFEWFDFDIRLNAAKQSPFVSEWKTTALLAGTTSGKRDNTSLTWGLYQYFRYYDLQSSAQHFRLGEAVSLGGGCIYEHSWRKHFKLAGGVHLTAVPLGAVASDFLVLDDRDYNWGSGYGVKAGVKFFGGEKFRLHLASEMTHLFSWNGYPENVDWEAIDPTRYHIQGDKSRAVGVVSSLEAEYLFTPHWGLSLTYRNYYRHTDYAYQGVRTHLLNDCMLSASYHF